MKLAPSPNAVLDLESYVESFESACAASGAADVAKFFPDPSRPDYAEIVAELLRVDLELGWRRGMPRSLDDYRRQFADVLSDASRWEAMAFEEFRLRRQAGESIAPQEYRLRYGVDATQWPSVADEPAATVVRWPEQGEEFLDFQLEEELGRGAFGRVFLARQAGLAHRPVALKLSPGRSIEPQRLAQLQHANIVPVYSVHEAGGLQGVCMPYLGRATLAELTGRLRRRDRLPRSGVELISTVVGCDATQVAPGRWPQRQSETADGASRSGLTASTSTLAPSIRQRLEQTSFVDAVVWIGAQLAAGLAHAHERGILHRDLKPANVLLADDGRPMILDFNLAEEVAATDPRRRAIGGTLPYMAPEHLDALDTGQGLDRRSDLYSLGVILFELLAQRLPFETPRLGGAELAPQLAAQRRRGAPSVRQFNAAVPRSVAAIVARCLAPLPEDRYQGAEELHADLDRHLQHLPLQHARDRSPTERAAKWARRHPRLASGSSIAAAAAAVLALGALSWQARGEKLAGLQAEQDARAFLDDAPALRAPLSLPGLESAEVAAAVDAARDRLGEFVLTGAGPPQTTPTYQHLSPALRSGVDAELARLTTLVASAAKRQESAAPRAGRTGSQAAEGLAWGTLDEHDSQLRAIALAHDGRYGDAMPKLLAWRNQSPTDVAAWIMLGHAAMRLGNLLEAEECFTAAVEIAPQLPLGYFQRGLARLEARKFSGAESDFTKVLQTPGCHGPALVNRALARRGLQKLEEALADLDAALAVDPTQTRIRFIKAELLRRLGRDADAQAELAQGLATTPGNAAGWLARGSAKLADDPAGALADFEQAERLAPGSPAAQRLIVHALADHLGRDRDALAVLDEMLARNSDDGSAHASRAVVRARLGDVAGAQSDAAAALKLNHDPLTVLQSAGVFALASKHEPGLAAHAIALVGRAVGMDPALAARASGDVDLAAIRADERFARVLAAARTLAAGGADAPLKHPKQPQEKRNRE